MFMSLQSPPMNMIKFNLVTVSHHLRLKANIDLCFTCDKKNLEKNPKVLYT